MRGGASRRAGLRRIFVPAEYKRARPTGALWSLRNSHATCRFSQVVTVRRYGLFALVLLLTVGCGGGAPASACAPDSPRPQGLLLGEGEHARVRVGQLVYVHLVVGERLMRPGRPLGFPWASARSSTSAVLVRIPVCRSKGAVSTLPVRAFAFRARSPGRAHVTAPLSASWRPGPPIAGLRPFSAEVEVRA